MALSWGSIISIIYFFLYTILLFVVSFIVYKQGTHDKVVSKSFLKDVWAQRSIYAAVLVHFYDTATDIGIMVIWYGLMQDELNGHNYEDVDMKVYFWSGFTFMILYRLIVVIFIIKFAHHDKWYAIILALLDMYILVAVYQSFTDAQDIIYENQQPSYQPSYQPIELQTMDSKSRTDKQIDVHVKQVVLCQAQKIIQFGEAVIEAMPQVILQAAFIIRSANDVTLRSSTPPYLLLVSLIASVISVANKYRMVDDGDDDDDEEDGSIKPEYKGLKPKLKFPGCLNWWYLVAAIWRYCHIITRFTLFSLIWGVCGGYWIGIYAAFSYLTSIAAGFCTTCDGEEHCCFSFLISFPFAVIILPGVYTPPSDLKAYLIRWFDNLMGYVLVIVFMFVSFECKICNDAKDREFGQNDIIDILLAIGIGSYVFDVILAFPLYFNEVFDKMQ
eukprot:364825_1